MTIDNAFKLETERCLILPLTKKHVLSFMEYRNDPNVAKYQSWYPNCTEQQCLDFIQQYGGDPVPISDSWKQLAIEEKGTEIHLGDIGLRLFDENRQIELGITLRTSSQGKGYATESLRKIVEWSFFTLQIHRISVTIDVLNTSSINLFQKLGFRKEAKFIENIWFKGEWGSEIAMALLRSEFS